MSTNLRLGHLSGKTWRHANEHMDAYYWFSKWGEGQTAVSLTSQCAKTSGPLMKLGITLPHAHEDMLRGRRRSMWSAKNKRIRHYYCCKKKKIIYFHSKSCNDFLQSGLVVWGEDNNNNNKKLLFLIDSPTNPLLGWKVFKLYLLFFGRVNTNHPLWHLCKMSLMCISLYRAFFYVVVWNCIVSVFARLSCLQHISPYQPK